MNEPNTTSVLTINGGSSSIKFALYLMEGTPDRLFHGQIESIGTKNATLSFANAANNKKNSINVPFEEYDGTLKFLIDWLEQQQGFGSVKAIGHRIVHGMDHTKPEVISDALIGELKNISSYDPEHLPGEISLIEGFTKRCPDLVQVACFDTSFHRSMPLVAQLIPIPRKYYEKGIRRYGFHGLSYAYLLEELQRVAGAEAALGKIIMAHLGSGASLAAVKGGKSMDTSMGFTPASGIPMGTRSGDIDPGVAWYLMQEEKIQPQEFSRLVNHQSGLLGISGTSSDMRELTKHQDTDSRAAEAIALFCYQVKKWIGSFAAVLGGVDTLIFSGGIGENAPGVRARICNGLQFLGMEIDEKRNTGNDAVISTDASKTAVRVMNTNEELMIAKMVWEVLHHTK